MQSTGTASMDDEEQRNRFAAIVASSDDAIISKTLDGIIETWNEGATRIFGYSSEEAIGKPITILIPPDRLDEEPAILARLRAGERVDHFETIRVRKDGSLLNISLTISPVRNSSGKIVGASKIARDITAQKRTEEALRVSNERFRLMADSAPVLIWISDEAQVSRLVQQRLARVYGAFTAARTGIRMDTKRSRGRLGAMSSGIR